MNLKNLTLNQAIKTYNSRIQVKQILGKHNFILVDCAYALENGYALVELL